MSLPAGCTARVASGRTPVPTLSVTIFFVVALLVLATVGCGSAAQANSGSSTGKTVSSGKPPNDLGVGSHLTVSGAMPSAASGMPFSSVVSVSGGNAPYTFALVWQTLPPGLQLNPESGAITGTPTSEGNYEFSISATDGKKDYGDHRFTIDVAHAISGTVNVSVSPASTQMAPGGTQQFTASVTGTSNTAVTWSAGAGTITSSGLFTAPNATTSEVVSVTATSVSDPGASAFAIVNVNPGSTPPPPPPPPPTGADNRYCKVGDVPNFGGNDGPAQMPQTCFYTGSDATPAPGKLTVLASGGDLQGALNAASCGDTIQLQAGATYDYSQAGLVFPAKSCDDQHWIIVRTSASDAQLPPEGSRLTPCWAGVVSLPARPAYPCPASGAANLTAKILLSGNGSITFSGANHYRMIGLEITRSVGSGVAYNLAVARGGSKIIFDRVWMHGDALDETTRGVSLSDGNEIAVVDSYLNDFHCNSITGTCTDSQAINGGCNSLSGSSNTFKVVDNFLEAAAEGILFGGCGSTHTSSDVEIRRNHFYKPTTWDPNDPNYIGTPFIVKNNFELKDGDHFLFEGNMLDSTWGGYSQVGFSILLTPKNPSNTAPGAHVSDITIRYISAAHSGAAMQIGAGLDSTGASTLGLWDVSVHDAVFDDVSTTCFGCGGNAIQITRGDPNAAAHDIVVNHITVPRTTNVNAGFILGSQTPSWQNVAFTNNIVTTGTYQMIGTGAGTSDCSHGWDPQDPTATIGNCWANYNFSTNVMLSGFGTWPGGNWMDTAANVQFVNYNNGVGGDYTLAPSSPYKNKASDGKDVGADTSAISTETAGID